MRVNKPSSQFRDVYIYGFLWLAALAVLISACSGSQPGTGSSPASPNLQTPAPVAPPESQKTASIPPPILTPAPALTPTPTPVSSPSPAPAASPQHQPPVIATPVPELVPSPAPTPGPSFRANPEEGKRLFYNIGCIGCHMAQGVGGNIGPDLSDIGKRRDAAYIEQSIRDPRAYIVPGYPRIMPLPDEMGLNEESIAHLVAWLTSLK